jgi:hypothetical protein
MNDKEPERMSQAEQHAVWWASLSADEKMIAELPSGYWIDLIFIAYVKRLVISREMTLRERIENLEFLDGRVHGVISPAALAAVHPANETFMQIVQEALQLDRGAEDWPRSGFDVLFRWSVFNDLLKLNPSIVEAIKLCRHYARG